MELRFKLPNRQYLGSNETEDWNILLRVQVGASAEKVNEVTSVLFTSIAQVVSIPILYSLAGVKWDLSTMYNWDLFCDEIRELVTTDCNASLH